MAGKKKTSPFGNVLWLMALLVSLTVFAVAGYQLVTTLLEYREAQKEYQKLEQYVQRKDKETADGQAEEKKGDPKENLQQEEAGGGSEQGDEASGEQAGQNGGIDPGVPSQEPDVDFDGLRAINEDVVGWLVVDALGISYPVMQGEDNDFYLHRTTEKTYNFSGSIFLDYENQADLSDPHSIIYGHNMKDGTMFGMLHRFREREVYENGLYFWVCTPQKNYLYRIFTAYEAEVGSDTYTLFERGGKEVQEYAEQMRKKSEIPTGTFAFQKSEKIVTLSTCTGDTSTRFVVQGIRVN